MCTCIDNIKASYTEVKKVATRVSKESFVGPTGIKGDIQPNIDEFLDAINYFTREIHGLTNAINNLVEVTKNNFCDISEDLANGNSPMVMWPPCLHSPFVGSDLK